MDPCYSRFGFEVLFAEAEQSYGATEGRHDEQLDWLTERGLLDTGSSVLDVGCYDCAFLAKLPGNIKKLGVDIDATAIARGRERLAGQDAELVHADFERLDLDQRIDTITMFHVLEHLARPVAVLQQLRRLSHRATRLVVEVPIVEGGRTNDVVGFFSVQHLTHFSRRSLETCLSQAAWQAVEWVQQSGYNGCRVVAVPDAPTRVSRGDPADVGHALRVMASWEHAASGVMEALEHVLECERCVVWGAGLHTEYLYQRTALFDSDRRRRYFLVDSDPRKQGQTWRGLSVYPPAVFGGLDVGTTPIVVSTYGSQDEVKRAASAFELANIVTLYDELHVY